MENLGYFVWHQRRAHGKERQLMHYMIQLPPFLGHVLRIFDDGNTFQQTMEHIAKDVGLPVDQWVASYTPSGWNDGPVYLYIDAQWHLAAEYHNGMHDGNRMRRLTLTTHRVWPGTFPLALPLMLTLALSAVVILCWK